MIHIDECINNFKDLYSLELNITITNDLAIVFQRRKKSLFQIPDSNHTFMNSKFITYTQKHFS